MKPNATNEKASPFMVPAPHGLLAEGALFHNLACRRRTVS
jgi:hypothetical protein